jgi:hypothetical protein
VHVGVCVLHCFSLVLRDVVRCDMNFIFFLFSLVSDFFGKKESVDANVGTTTAFDEQLAQSGTVVHSDIRKRKRRTKQISLADADETTNLKRFQATVSGEAVGFDFDAPILSHTTSRDVCPIVAAISSTVSL